MSSSYYQFNNNSFFFFKFWAVISNFYTRPLTTPFGAFSEWILLRLREDLFSECEKEDEMEGYELIWLKRTYFDPFYLNFNDQREGYLFPWLLFTGGAVSSFQPVLYFVSVLDMGECMSFYAISFCLNGLFMVPTFA